MRDRRLKLIDALKQELVENKIQHVQLLLVKYHDRLAIHFVSVDNDTYKKKVKEIANRYCESLYPVRETKTTITYLF